MFKNLELTFKEGTILTKEMLRELRDIFKDSLDILYSSYPDGILAGMEVIERDGIVCVKGGLVKYQDRIYRQAEEDNLSKLVEGWIEDGLVEEQAEYQLMLVPAEARAIEQRNTQILRTLQWKAVPKGKEEKGIPFADFKLPARGKITLYHEIDREDISEARFWNMVCCPYACRECITYHPHIFEVIREKIMQKEGKTYFDYMVLNQLSLTGILSFAFMKMAVEDDCNCQLPVQGGEHGSSELNWRREVLREFIKLIEKGHMQVYVSNMEQKSEERQQISGDNGKLLP